MAHMDWKGGKTCGTVEVFYGHNGGGEMGITAWLN